MATPPGTVSSLGDQPAPATPLESNPEYSDIQQQRINETKQAFQSFGYTPSDAEINAISGSYGFGVEKGNQAIANYVNAVNNIQKADASNPLKQVLSDEKGFFTDTQRQAADAYQKAYGEPPKLFGNLTPEQIDQYLAPVTRATQEAKAGTETTMGRRGTAGSSLEAQALAEQDRLYKQNVLSSGLQVGLNQQQQMAALASQLYGELPGLQGQTANTAGLLSNQSREDAATKSSLLPYLYGYAGQALSTEQGQVGQRYTNAKLGDTSKNFFQPGQLGGDFLNQFATNLGANLGGKFLGGTSASTAGSTNPTSGSTNPTSLYDPGKSVPSPSIPLFLGAGG